MFCVCIYYGNNKRGLITNLNNAVDCMGLVRDCSKGVETLIQRIRIPPEYLTRSMVSKGLNSKLSTIPSMFFRPTLVSVKMTIIGSWSRMSWLILQRKHDLATPLAFHNRMDIFGWVALTGSLLSPLAAYGSRETPFFKRGCCKLVSNWSWLLPQHSSLGFRIAPCTLKGHLVAWFVRRIHLTLSVGALGLHHKPVVCNW